MRRLRSERGSVTVVATLALMVLVAVSLAASAALIAAHSRGVKHQENGLQALYLAEMGVEEAMTLAAEGEIPESLTRTIERETAPGVVDDGAEVAEPNVVGADTDARLVVGEYEVVAAGSGAALAVRSRGTVATPAGLPVVREVEVECERVRGRWIVTHWERVP